MKKLIGSKSRFVISAFLLFSVIIISGSCSKKSMADLTGGNNTGANEVLIQNMAFSPATITVAAGTTITWTNKDGMTHTITSDSNLFDSGNIANNGTYTHMFATAGTFAYHCSIHTDMMASVKVN